MYNKQPFRKSTTLSCSESWLVGEIAIVLLSFYTNTRLFLGNWLTVAVWYALFGFSSFWPWKLVALNITGQCHHRQLPRPTRAKPHLPDVYIDIYIKREKYLWIYFFPTLWWELLIRNNSLFWWNTAMLFWSVYFLGSRLWILVIH